MKTSFAPTFGKNTVYILDIDNTTVQTCHNAQVKKDAKKEKILLGLMDESDVLVFNTGRPKSDIDTILSPCLQERASHLVTRLGSAIWEKTPDQKWTPCQEWNKRLMESGFDSQKIKDTFHSLAEANKNSKTSLYEYHEPFSSCIVIGSDSPDVYLPLKNQLEETLKKSGQKGVNLGSMAEKNLSVVMATPQGATKGTASDFVIDGILKKHPQIDKVLVAGDSTGDLANFLINTPQKIKNTLFAFVNPEAKKFFEAVYSSRKTALPLGIEKAKIIPHGYYASTKIFVPKDALPAPKGLIESIRYFKNK